MLCLEHKAFGRGRTLYVAESKQDFIGWNFIGFVDHDKLKKLKLVIACRNVMGRMEIRSIIATSELVQELRRAGIQGVEEIIV